MKNLFESLKSNKFVENMTVLSKTNLSLLNTLNQLQTEYEDLKLKYDKLMTEYLKVKGNK